MPGHCPLRPQFRLNASAGVSPASPGAPPGLPQAQGAGSGARFQRRSSSAAPRAQGPPEKALSPDTGQGGAAGIRNKFTSQQTKGYRCSLSKLSPNTPLPPPSPALFLDSSCPFATLFQQSLRAAFSHQLAQIFLKAGALQARRRLPGGPWAASPVQTAARGAGSLQAPDRQTSRSAGPGSPGAGGGTSKVSPPSPTFFCPGGHGPGRNLRGGGRRGVALGRPRGWNPRSEAPATVRSPVRARTSVNPGGIDPWKSKLDVSLSL